jgi:general secretion pathway protein E
VFELLEVNDHIRSMIKERQDTSAIRAEAVAGGMKSMLQDGVAKAFFGETILEEVFRVAV